MLAVIIGKHGVDYYTIKKKDQDKHYFSIKGQLYKIYPDALTPCDIFHNGAWVGSDSIIVFEENGTQPYHCKYPHDYDLDPVLSSIDEHKLMMPKKKSWGGFFNGSGGGFKTLLEFMPWLLIGVVLLVNMFMK